MKYILIILLISYVAPAIAQQRWHSISDTLKEPPNNSGYYTTVIWFNRYDTVSVLYETKGSGKKHRGYKLVFVKEGFYTDDDNTFGVLYNSQVQRVYNVTRFKFK